MSSNLEAVSTDFAAYKLTQARHLAAITRTELARRAGVSAAVVGQYEAGTTRPRAATVGQLALALSVPAEFFCGEPTTGTATIPSAQTSFFRSLRSTTLREREQAAATAGLIVQLARVLEQRVEIPPFARPQCVTALDASNPPQAAAAAARCVRETWQLGDEPIGHMVRLLEERGVIVARLAFETGRVDAFSWTAGDRPIVILGSDKNGYERSRFDAAHELGHLLMHADDPEPANAALERQANRFASALLMPEQVIRDRWPTGSRLQWPKLIALKSDLGVSLAALLYRAKDLEFLTETAHQQAMRYLTRTWGRRAEPGRRRTPEQPALLGAIVQLLEDNGVDLDQITAEAHLLAADDLRTKLGLQAPLRLRLSRS